MGFGARRLHGSGARRARPLVRQWRRWEGWEGGGARCARQLVPV